MIDEWRRTGVPTWQRTGAAAFHTPKGYQDLAQGAGFGNPGLYHRKRGALKERKTTDLESKTNKQRLSTEVSKGSKDLIPVQTSVFPLQSLASRFSDVQNC
jgi:hypothetical protein